MEYSDFLDRAQLLMQKLLKQCYVAPRLKSLLQKYYGRLHHIWSYIGQGIYRFTLQIELQLTRFYVMNSEIS
jgi:VanZ family protein